MKSRFVIRTEEKIIGVNGVIIPALNIETEVEYSIQESIGAYELFKRAVKETPEIVEDMVKAITLINTKRDEEWAEQNEKAQECKKQCCSKVSPSRVHNNIVSVIKCEKNIYVIKNIDRVFAKTIVIEVPLLYDDAFIANLLTCALSLTEEGKNFYFYICIDSEMEKKTIDYLNNHSDVAQKMDKSFVNTHFGKIHFIPDRIDKLIIEISDYIKRL